MCIDTSDTRQLVTLIAAWCGGSVMAGFFMAMFRDLLHR